MQEPRLQKGKIYKTVRVFASRHKACVKPYLFAGIDPGPVEALEHVRLSGADAILASFPIAEWTPAGLLEEIQRLNRRIPVLIHEPAGTAEEAFRMGEMGAYYFCCEPLDRQRLARQFLL